MRIRQNGQRQQPKSSRPPATSATDKRTPKPKGAKPEKISGEEILKNKLAPRGKTAATKDPKTAKPLAPAMAAKKYINVYLSLGSNMGDRRGNLRSAAGLISKEIGKIAKQSKVYETQPWGKKDQDAFLNQVIMINTMLSPRDMLEKITLIERELGRVRKEKFGPRTIDVDILFYGKRVVRDKGLEIPHPELHKRAFVLVPLLELAADLEHPIFQKQIDELYMDCEDSSEVVMLEA